MGANDVAGAAKLAAGSPQGILRTPATIQRFQAIPGAQGQPQPVFQYFHALLEKGKLNEMESMELARPVLQQGKTQLLEKWLTDDKLEYSEQLGDLVAQTDVNMALSVYLRANVPEKAINCMVQRGEYDNIVKYATKVGYRCDYSFMLQNLVRSNPTGALEFAKQLAAGSLIDLNVVVDTFMAVNRIQETTAFLLEALKGNKQEEGNLQTKLLEINLRGGAPQVVDAILQNNMFTHYDRQYIAKLCEGAGLSQRALEHYTDVDDIKRSLVAMCANPQMINTEFMLSYFGSLSPEASLECLKELLTRNMRGNMQIVTQVSAKYSEQVGCDALITMYENFKCFEGLYYYLGQVGRSFESSRMMTPRCLCTNSRDSTIQPTAVTTVLIITTTIDHPTLHRRSPLGLIVAFSSRARRDGCAFRRTATPGRWRQPTPTRDDDVVLTPSWSWCCSHLHS